MMKNLVKMNNDNCNYLNSKNKIFSILYFLNIYQIIINQIIFNMYVNLWECKMKFIVCAVTNLFLAETIEFKDSNCKLGKKEFNTKYSMMYINSFSIKR